MFTTVVNQDKMQKHYLTKITTLMLIGMLLLKDFHFQWI